MGCGKPDFWDGRRHAICSGIVDSWVVGCAKPDGLPARRHAICNGIVDSGSWHVASQSSDMTGGMPSAAASSTAGSWDVVSQTSDMTGGMPSAAASSTAGCVSWDVVSQTSYGLAGIPSTAGDDPGDEPNAPGPPAHSPEEEQRLLDAHFAQLLTILNLRGRGWTRVRWNAEFGNFGNPYHQINRGLGINFWQGFWHHFPVYLPRSRVWHASGWQPAWFIVPQGGRRAAQRDRSLAMEMANLGLIP